MSGYSKLLNPKFLASLKSKHLHNAFILRAEWRYDEAAVELNLACDTDDDPDGVAHYVRGEALQYGGFGLRRNTDACINDYQISANLGCIFGIVYFVRRRDVYNDSDDKYLSILNERHEEHFVSETTWRAYHNLDVLSFDHPMCTKQIEDGDLFAMVSIIFSYGYMLDKWTDLKLLCAKIGDVTCQISLCSYYDEYEKYDEFLRQAALQKCNTAFSLLGSCYYTGNYTTIKKDPIFGARCLVQTQTEDMFIVRCLREYDEEYDVHTRMAELFEYGYGLTKYINLCASIEARSIGITREPIRIYLETINLTRLAMDTFVMCCIKTGWASKDIRRVICGMIWESRQWPHFWLKEEKIKKLKK